MVGKKLSLTRAWGWCDICKESKTIKELYIDQRKLVVTLECGHEFYGEFRQ